MNNSLLNKQFSGMAQAMPGANERMARQLDSTRKIQLQQAIAQTTTPKAAPVAQALGAQQAQAAGQAATATQAANIQGAQQLGSSFLREQATSARQALQEQSLANAKANADEAHRLGQLDASLKRDLFDSQLNFREDELGRTLFNDRQLLDYKLASAKSDEDLLNYEQNVKQLSDRKMQMLKAAHAKVMQEMENAFSKSEQELDQASKEKLYRAKAELEKKMAKEKAKAANRAAMFSAAGSVIGAVAGSIVPGLGTAVGAMAGAAIGSGLGSVAASQTDW
jgi:hypothetical protein